MRSTYSLAAAVVKPLGRPSEREMNRNASDRKKLTTKCFNLAREKIDAGDLQGGVDQLNVCCAAAPTDARYFHRRGVCAQKLGLHEEALDDFTECTNLQPNEPSYHFFHGGALRTLNRLPEAVTAYTRALSVDSENGDHFNKRGEVYQQLGEHAKAIEDLDVAIKLLEKIRVVFTPLVTRAVSLRAQGRFDAAQADLKKALSRRPTDIPTMLLLGQVYMQAHDWLNAIQSLNVALQLDPAHAALHDQLGEGTFGCALGYGKQRKQAMKTLDMSFQSSEDQLKELERLEAEYFTAAEQCFERAIKFDAADPEFVFHRGKLLLHQRKYDQALDDFQRAAALGGKNLVEYLFYVGHTYAIVGERTLSINAYRKAVLTDSTHQESLIKLGRALHLTGEYDQAARLMSSALIADPTNVDVLVIRGCIFREMMDFEPALKDLDKALRLAPSKMDAHFQRAQVLLGLERYSEAHHALREALERGYNATEVHNWQGLVYRAERKWSQAVDALSQSIQEDPFAAKYYFNRGQCHQFAGAMGAALEDFSRALAHDPGCVEYLHTRGMVQCRVEAYGAALADLTSAQAGMSPALDEELFAESWYYVGVAHTGLGQLELALAAYSKALRLRPLYAHVVHERAKVNQDMGNNEAAMADFDKVLELQPSNSHALFRRGFLWKRNKKYDEAAQDFEDAKKMEPANPSLWLDYNRIGEMDIVTLCRPGEEAELRTGQTALRRRIDQSALLDV